MSDLGKAINWYLSQKTPEQQERMHKAFAAMAERILKSLQKKSQSVSPPEV